MSSTGVEFIRKEIDWDEHDPWGSVRAAQFDLCEAFWVAHGLCLAGFQPTSVVPFEFSSERGERLCGAMELAIVTYEDVRYWLKVLNRLENMVIDAGREY